MNRLRLAESALLRSAMLLVSACAAPAVPAPAVEKERIAIPEPAPVVRDGRRYEAVPWGRARGLGQNGGYIAIVDTATNREVGVVKVYGPEPDDDRESDKRDVFIARLTFDATGSLRIEDERGRAYLVDLATFAVTRPRS